MNGTGKTVVYNVHTIYIYAISQNNLSWDALLKESRYRRPLGRYSGGTVLLVSVLSKQYTVHSVVTVNSAACSPVFCVEDRQAAVSAGSCEGPAPHTSEQPGAGHGCAVSWPGRCSGRRRSPVAGSGRLRRL